MAGIWETWQGPTGPLHSCAIVVTNANPEIAIVHDRIPVIIEPSDYSAWLDPRPRDLAALTKLLRPVAGPWALSPVSRRVNNPRNDDSGLIQPAPGVAAP